MPAFPRHCEKYLLYVIPWFCLLYPAFLRRPLYFLGISVFRKLDICQASYSCFSSVIAEIF